MTTAEAFSGTWALNVRGWLWVVPPMMAAAILQELSTGFADAPWVIGAALTRVGAVIAFSIAVVAVSRLLTGRVVPVASAVLWIGGGIVHGVVGGALALAVGLEPDWLYRTTFWVATSGAWMPILTFALAHWDENRRLIARRTQLEEELDRAAARANEDADARVARVTAAIDDAVSPALVEIRAQLAEDGAAVDTGTARAIAARLDELAARTDELATHAGAAPAPCPGRASVARAAAEFELRRPVLAALATAALSSAFLPEAYREGGWTHAAEFVVALAISTLATATVFALLRPLPGTRRSLLSRIGIVVAGLLGPVALVLLDWHPLEPSDIAFTALLPFVSVLAGSASATAVSLQAANAELAERVRADEAELAELHELARAAEETGAASVDKLVRGELNGRLAACAMALAFLANGDVTAQARGEVVDVVLGHLDAAAAELRSR